MASNASRPNAAPFPWQQASAAKDETMDTIPRVVNDIWSNLHDLDRSKAHGRHIRPQRRRRAIGETKYQVLVTTAYGSHGRNIVGRSKHIGTTLRQGMEHTKEAATSSVDAKSLETVQASTDCRSVTFVLSASRESSELGEAAGAFHIEHRLFSRIRTPHRLAERGRDIQALPVHAHCGVVERTWQILGRIVSDHEAYTGHSRAVESQD